MRVPGTASVHTKADALAYLDTLELSYEVRRAARSRMTEAFLATASTDEILAFIDQLLDGESAA